ncbi:MAG: hypothetical protein RL748_1244, partial [Pseudomonadota bacterium]
RFPNEEVRQSLYGALLEVWGGRCGVESRNMLNLYALLERHDLAGLKEVFHAFFASIPHQWYTKNKLAEYEGYYASVFYSYFMALGMDVRVEDASNLGRIDMMVRLGGRILLFEFKVVDGEAQGSAMQQLKDKCYADKYRAEGLPVYLIGVEFSKKTRNVVGFAVEAVSSLS